MKTIHSFTNLALAISFILSGLSPLLANPKIVPEGLSAAEWAEIRSVHEQWKHRFVEERDGTVTATNPGQHWKTTFDGRGFLSKPKGRDWRWGLELTSYGIGGSRQLVSGEARADVDGVRLMYRRDDILEEWFVNDVRGLEQGWTFSERPTGSADGKLRLDLAVRGDLRPEVDPEGQSVNFMSGESASALTYGGLKAWDATGRALSARFVSRGDGIAVTVDDRDATYPVVIDPVAQQAYLKASHTGEVHYFGDSVAVSGDTVVVGASGESSDSSGVNGMFNNSLYASGAAYIFVHSEGVWSQQAYLKPSNPGENSNFGYSVAISGDTVVVGAILEDSSTTGVNSTPNNVASNFNSGAAYVFVRDEGSWSQQAYLKASNTDANDWFGWAVAVSGETIVVGARFEDSSATGIDSTSNNSSTDSGAAYVFVRYAGVWSQQAYLKPSNTGTGDEFGWSVAISDNTVVVGAPREDSSTTGINSTSNDSSTDSGAAYVFVSNSGVWSQQAYFKPGNTGGDDQFGCSVSISGDTILVGAPLEDSSTSGIDSTPSEGADAAGAAYVFTRDGGGGWSQQSYLKASNTGVGYKFGWSAAVSGDTIVVGSLGEASSTSGVNSTPDGDDFSYESGATYVFTRGSEGGWSQQGYLKASNAGYEDQFGWSVAVSDGSVVVGARKEDGGTTGVNSTPNEGVGDSGAAYIFTVTPGPATNPTPPTIAPGNTALKASLLSKIEKLKKKQKSAKKKGQKSKTEKFGKKVKKLQSRLRSL